MAVTTVTSGSTIIANTVLQVGLNAYGVVIRWQSTDFQPAVSTSSSLPVTTASTMPTHNPEPSNSSLSTGAKAGIAVGVVLVALLAFLVILFVFKRKRANGKAEAYGSELQNPGFGVGKSELAATESVSILPRELGGSEVVEPEAEGRNRSLYELEAH
jgi:hypothetical protein